MFDKFTQICTLYIGFKRPSDHADIMSLNIESQMLLSKRIFEPILMLSLFNKCFLSPIPVPRYSFPSA